jgi:hypothetical protein
MPARRIGARPCNAPAGVRVELLPYGEEKTPRTGPTASIHEANLWVPSEAVRGLLTADFLRRLASAYRRFLGQVSAGLLRIRFEAGSESLVLLLPRPSLLRLRTPVCVEGPDWAEATWEIERGLLVASVGRDRGSLRIRLMRPAPAAAAEGASVPILARMEVEGYYPRIRGSGVLASAGTWLYAQTQARIHTLVMRGFLRSLTQLELPPSATRSSVVVTRGGQ